MRVVIVGGGMVGALCAWRAAQAGHAVTTVDDGHGGAWQVAAGMLAPALEAAAGEDDLLRLARVGADRWPATARDLAAAAGDDGGYVRGGTLLVARGEDDLSALREILDVHRQLGAHVEPLRSRACRQREPSLSPAVRGGLLATDDHRVDPRRAVAAARAAARAAGARSCTGRAVGLATRAGSVVGVQLADGQQLPADAVVLAGGWRSAHLDGVPSALARWLRPVKGQLLVLRATQVAPPLADTVRGLVHGRSVYLVPREDGRLVVGATEEERGEDTTVTAGGIRALLDDASALVPGVDELEVIETLAGLRPGSADGRPLIGATDVDGLVVATGHGRNGVLLAPLTAEAVVATLAGEATPEPLRCADPARALGAPVASRTDPAP